MDVAGRDVVGVERCGDGENWVGGWTWGGEGSKVVFLVVGCRDLNGLRVNG